MSNKLIVQILVPIVVGTALTLSAPIIAKYVFPPKYSITGQIKNKDKVLAGVIVSLDSAVNETTDDRGVFIFSKLKEGVYTIYYEYNGVTRRNKVLCMGDEKVINNPIDINELYTSLDDNLDTVPPVSGNPTKESQNTKKVSEAKMLNENNVKKLTEFKELKSNVDSIKTGHGLNAIKLVSKEIKITPNALLDKLQLKVRVDNEDRNGKLVAFNYYLDGDKNLLDAIKEVYYQRIHETFPEYNKYYFSSTNRETNFTFKGYQWGRISNVYVGIRTNNDLQSDIVLKEINYSN